MSWNWRALYQTVKNFLMVDHQNRSRIPDKFYRKPLPPDQAKYSFPQKFPTKTEAMSGVRTSPPPPFKCLIFSLNVRVCCVLCMYVCRRRPLASIIGIASSGSHSLLSVWRCLSLIWGRKLVRQLSLSPSHSLPLSLSLSLFSHSRCSGTFEPARCLWATRRVESCHSGKASGGRD
jgi:hypothetical protein